jgi:hypothetical protein
MNAAGNPDSIDIPAGLRPRIPLSAAEADMSDGESGDELPGTPPDDDADYAQDVAEETLVTAAGETVDVDDLGEEEPAHFTDAGGDLDDNAEADDDDDVPYAARLRHVAGGVEVLDADDDGVLPHHQQHEDVERKPRLQVARIRKLVASGSDSGAVAADAAKRATLSVEDFIADLALEAAHLAVRRTASTGNAAPVVTYAHLVEVCQTVERFFFLTDVILPERAGLIKGQQTITATLAKRGR